MTTPGVRVLCYAVTRRRLWHIAKARFAALPDPGATRRRSPQYDDLVLNFGGMRGEWGASTVVGVPWRDTHGDDDGADLLLDGTRWAVKFNHRAGGYCIVERKSDLDGDPARGFRPVVGVIFVNGACGDTCRCVAPGDELLTVAGWFWREEFWARARCTDWGLGVRWYTPPGECHPIAEIWAAIRTAGLADMVDLT